MSDLRRGEGDRGGGEEAIYVNGGKRSMLKVTKTKAGYRGAITMGVIR